MDREVDQSTVLVEDSSSSLNGVGKPQNTVSDERGPKEPEIRSISIPRSFWSLALLASTLSGGAVAVVVVFIMLFWQPSSSWQILLGLCSTVGSGLLTVRVREGMVERKYRKYEEIEDDIEEEVRRRRRRVSRRFYDSESSSRGT
jgi:hypothetical protein